MNEVKERRAWWIGFALWWYLFLQALVGRFWLSHISGWGRIRLLGHEVWLVDCLTELWWIAPGLAMLAALRLVSSKSLVVSHGASGLLSGILSMLPLGLLWMIGTLVLGLLR